MRFFSHLVGFFCLVSAYFWKGLPLWGLILRAEKQPTSGHTTPSVNMIVGRQSTIATSSPSEKEASKPIIHKPFQFNGFFFPGPEIITSATSSPLTRFETSAAHDVAGQEYIIMIHLLFTLYLAPAQVQPIAASSSIIIPHACEPTG